MSSITGQTDLALLFGTIVMFVAVLLAFLGALALLRRIRDGLTKWRYRRKYNAEFRKHQR